MPLDAADPRPRNPFGQFSPGTAATAGQMNRAYGIRTNVLASLLRTRPAMKNIPALPAKDIARVAALAARARKLVNLEKLDLGEKPAEPEPLCGCAETTPKISYPRLYITRADDALAAFPRSGQAVVDYRITEVSRRENEDGKITSSARLEIRSIDTGDDADGAEGSAAGAALAGKLERLIGFGKAAAAARALRTSVELARGEFALPAMHRAKLIPYVSPAPTAYRNPTYANLVETVLNRTGPKGIQHRRDRLAKVLRATRATAPAAPAVAALSMLAARAVELAAPAPVQGAQVKRPRFVQEDGYMKIVQADGTASEIGRAPGFTNRLRRNKGKLVAGSLGAVAGVVTAKKLLGKARPAA